MAVWFSGVNMAYVPLGFAAAWELRSTHCLTAVLASLIAAGEIKLDRELYRLRNSGTCLLKKCHLQTFALIQLNSWTRASRINFRKFYFFFAKAACFQIMRKLAPFENFPLYARAVWVPLSTCTNRLLLAALKEPEDSGTTKLDVRKTPPKMLPFLSKHCMCTIPIFVLQMTMAISVKVQIKIEYQML